MDACSKRLYLEAGRQNVWQKCSQKRAKSQTIRKQAKQGKSRNHKTKNKNMIKNQKIKIGNNTAWYGTGGNALNTILCDVIQKHEGINRQTNQREKQKQL